jgi:hypothetical protein
MWGWQHQGYYSGIVRMHFLWSKTNLKNLTQDSYSFWARTLNTVPPTVTNSNRLQAPRPALESIQAPIQRVPGALPKDLNGQGMRLTTTCNPEVKTDRAVLQLSPPPHVFMVYWLSNQVKGSLRLLTSSSTKSNVTHLTMSRFHFVLWHRSIKSNSVTLLPPQSKNISMSPVTL